MNTRGPLRSSGGPPPTRGRGAPSAAATSRALQSGSSGGTGTGIRGAPAATTARGDDIRGAIDDMMDSYYGANDGPNSSLHGAHTASGHPVALNQQLGMAVSLDSPLARIRGVTVSIVNDRWFQGPKAQEGRPFVASDRNLLCMDVQDDTAVVGSADHGLIVFDVNTCRKKRELFSKRYGHTEWVTTCAFLPSGQILSGGMDSKLCLWDRSAVRCVDLMGHTGSISQVEVNDHGLAISAAYDRTLRLWDTRAATCLGTFAGHSQPVMHFSWYGGCLLSGDRRGVVKVWSMESFKAASSFETKHGQISALGQLLMEQGQLAVVGDQGGAVSVFDFARQKAPVHQGVVHPGGAVTSVKGMAANNTIVTAGADKKINCLEPRMGFEPLHTFSDHQDFVYSLETFGNLILSGGGNGWLLAHDATEGRCLYGLGANKAAVRSIFASQERLVCAGDDGVAMVYDF